MAQLPDLDKHLLGGAVPTHREVSHWCSTCQIYPYADTYMYFKKRTPFPKPISTWHPLHCTRKLSNFVMKNLKTSKRQVRKACKQDKISDSDLCHSLQRVMINGVGRHPHVCGIMFVIFAAQCWPAGKTYQYSYIWIYIFIQDLAKLPLVAFGLTGWWINNTENAL